MGVVTTYVCDVSGVQGKVEEFVKVSIAANKATFAAKFHTVTNTEKFIHVDVARKLNLVLPEVVQEKQPEPTLESKLMTLLKDYVADIAYESASEACSNYRN